MAVGPAITSITPTSGQQGQSLTVTLNGSNLTVAGAPVVTINQAQMLVTVTSATATQIRTTVGIPWYVPPAGYTLTVTFPQIGFLTRSFTVADRADQPPVISSVTPAKQFAVAPTSGSPPVAAVTKGACTRVTVSGQNLVGARAWVLQQADRTGPRLQETPGDCGGQVSGSTNWSDTAMTLFLDTSGANVAGYYAVFISNLSPVSAAMTKLVLVDVLSPEPVVYSYSPHYLVRGQGKAILMISGRNLPQPAQVRLVAGQPDVLDVQVDPQRSTQDQIVATIGVKPSAPMGVPNGIDTKLEVAGEPLPIKIVGQESEVPPGPVAVMGSDYIEGMGAQPSSPEPTGFAQPWLKVNWTHTLAQMDETRVMTSALELNNGVWRPMEGAMPELAVGEKRVMGLTVASAYLQVDVAGVVEVDPANPQNGFVNLDLRALGGTYLSGGSHLLEAMDGSAGQAVFKPGNQGSALNPLIEKVSGCVSVSPYTGPEPLLPGIFSPVVVRNTLPSNTGCGPTAVLRASATQATHVKPVSYTGDWTQELASESLSLNDPTTTLTAEQGELALFPCQVKTSAWQRRFTPSDTIYSNQSARMSGGVTLEVIGLASPALQAGDNDPDPLSVSFTASTDGTGGVSFTTFPSPVAIRSGETAPFSFGLQAGSTQAGFTTTLTVQVRVGSCSVFGQDSVSGTLTVLPLPVPEVELPSIDYVLKDGEESFQVTVSGGEVRLRFNTAGPAKFIKDGGEQTEITLTQSGPITIRGKMASGAVDDVSLVAIAPSTGNVLAEEPFSVVAIEKVEWVEKLSGQLDANPHPSAPIGRRIFPDRQSPIDATTRNVVSVQVTITPRLPDITVYFRSIDVDDPSSSSGPVDEDQNTSDPKYAKDNRGTPEEGRFIDNGANVGNQTSKETTVIFTGSGGAAIATVEFQVTMQPGDNFRVVASLNQNLSQVQAQQNDATLARVKDAMGNFIPNYTANQPPAPASIMASDVLTVWRRLHMEVDSMAAIPAYPDPQANVIRGNIVGIRGNASIATRVDVNLNLAANDASPRLDDPLNTGNGRFENGTIWIGSGSSGRRATANLRGNGGDYVLTMTGSGFDIPFDINVSGTPVASGQVIALSGTVFTVVGGLASAAAGDEFRVAGASMVVQSVNAQDNTVTVEQVNLPFELADDDTATMPHNPDTAQMQASYAVAYVEPKFVWSGSLDHNSQDVPFVLNVSDTDIVNVQRWGSRADNSNNFWVAYLLCAFQGVVLEDADPDGENMRRSTAGITAAADGGSLIYFAIHRERGIANPVDEERDTVVHEVAHLFDDADVTNRPSNGRGILHPETIHLIRKQPRPAPRTP